MSLGLPLEKIYFLDLEFSEGDFGKSERVKFDQYLTKIIDLFEGHGLMITDFLEKAYNKEIKKRAVAMLEKTKVTKRDLRNFKPGEKLEKELEKKNKIISKLRANGELPIN